MGGVLCHGQRPSLLWKDVHCGVIRYNALLDDAGQPHVLGELGRVMARYLVGTFPQPPRLEPDLRLSPHPAQHFQINLCLCSVAWCAYRLEVIHAVSLRWVFEPCAWYSMTRV